MNILEQTKQESNNKLVIVDHSREHIFSNEKNGIANYKRSMKKAIHAISNTLKERKTPFTGKSIEALREKFNKIQLEHFKETHSLEYVIEELKELYLDDCVHFHHPKYIAHLNCPILTPTLVAETFISSLE